MKRPTPPGSPAVANPAEILLKKERAVEYNRSMRSRLKDLDYPRLTAIVGFFGIAISGLVDLVEPRQRILAAILLALFGLIFLIPDFHDNPAWLSHLLLALETALVSALIILQPDWGFFPILFFLLSPKALIDFPNRTGVTWVVIFTLVTAAIFVYFQGWLGFIILLPYACGYFFFAVFGWNTLQANRERRRSEQLLAELQQAHGQLQEYASRLEELTITQERNRIAREMHDTLGHRLTVASVQLEGAQRLIHSNPERVEQILGTVREQIREGLGELRRTVAMLRSPVEEELPLEQALPKLADQVREASGIRVYLDLGGCLDPLPPAYRQALYRAAQEGLTNIQRHSQASEAWLHLDQRDGKFTLLISDNGVGISGSQNRTGFGLTGLKERAALLDGDFFVDPRPGGGTQLTFRIPLPKEAAYEDPGCG
jgi:signal transduction histidine kinase